MLSPGINCLRPAAFPGLELLSGHYRGAAFPRHMHEEYLLAVMTTGVERLTCRGSAVLAGRGDVIRLNPGEWHCNEGVNGGTYGYATIYLSAELLESIVAGIEGSRPSEQFNEPPVARAPALRAKLLALHHAFMRDSSLLQQQSLLLDCVVASGLATGTRRKAGTCLPPRSSVILAKSYIDAHFAEGASLSDLSRITGESPFSLLRAFARELGVPPHVYQTHCRITAAKSLLRAGTPLAETAHAVGFSDQSHMTRQFVRWVGITPKRYATAQSSAQ